MKVKLNCHDSEVCHASLCVYSHFPQPINFLAITGNLCLSISA